MYKHFTELHTEFFFWGGGGGDCVSLRSRISDINLARLILKGPELASVDFMRKIAEYYSCNGQQT